MLGCAKGRATSTSTSANAARGGKSSSGGVRGAPAVPSSGSGEAPKPSPVTTYVNELFHTQWVNIHQVSALINPVITYIPHWIFCNFSIEFFKFCRESDSWISIRFECFCCILSWRFCFFSWRGGQQADHVRLREPRQEKRQNRHDFFIVILLWIYFLTTKYIFVIVILLWICFLTN